MRFPFRRWRVGHLVLAWAAYWIGLVLVMLGPAIVAGWHMSQQANGHGNINAGVNDGIASANIIDAGRTTWSGSISLLNLALLVAIPPLMLWLIWLTGSSRTNNAGEMGLKNSKSQSRLRDAEPQIAIIDTSSSSTSKRRVREES
jgi:hypothetical protein